MKDHKHQKFHATITYNRDLAHESEKIKLEDFCDRVRNNAESIIESVQEKAEGLKDPIISFYHSYDYSYYDNSPEVYDHTIIYVEGYVPKTPQEIEADRKRAEKTAATKARKESAALTKARNRVSKLLEIYPDFADKKVGVSDLSLAKARKKIKDYEEFTIYLKNYPILKEEIKNPPEKEEVK